VYYARTGLYRSPLPPIRAAQARKVRDTSRDDDAWVAGWTHQFAEWLQKAVTGPLHAGRWTLARGMPSWSVPGHWQRLHAVDPDRGHITWFGYDDPDKDVRDVLPLRRLSPVDAGRVKSYRRQLREAILPPALLWWVSGLDVLLVLDGHDRITAALAEHTVPEVVVLALAADPRWTAAVQRRPLREYEGRIEHQKALLDQGDTLAKVRIANLTRRLAADLGDIARSEGRTRAWSLPGGREAWDQHAAALASGSTTGRIEYASQPGVVGEHSQADHRGAVGREKSRTATESSAPACSAEPAVRVAPGPGDVSTGVSRGGQRACVRRDQASDQPGC
jgi:hypothetical protein